MGTARTRAIALTDTQGYSAKRIGTSAGRDPVKMAAHVWTVLPTTIARVRKDFLVSVKVPEICIYLSLSLSLPLSMYGLFLCLLDNETDTQADRRIDRQTDAHTRLEYNKYD